MMTPLSFIRLRRERDLRTWKWPLDYLTNLFSYHKPFGDQAHRYERIRAAALTFAETIRGAAPPTYEREVALREIRSAVMWANAAIACNELPPEEEPSALEVGEQVIQKMAGVLQKNNTQRSKSNIIDQLIRQKSQQGCCLGGDVLSNQRTWGPEGDK